MKIIKAYQLLLETLKDYDQIEAHSISKIVLKDLFQTDHRSEKVLGVDQIAELESVCARLTTGEPIQYITGWADFYGAKFRVSPDVLIPRMETETLVATCIELMAKPQFKNPKILDIGTGSGCIAITLSKKLPKAQVFATDISEHAIRVAIANAALANQSIGFLHNDIFENIMVADASFSLVVSNPPYIPNKEKSLMQENVLAFEPHLALFVPDENPLMYYKRVAKVAQSCLEIGGILAFECNQYNAQDVLHLLKMEGYTHCELRNDLSGNQRVVFGIMQ
jgi:release factor glutamine methyltransferase